MDPVDIQEDLSEIKEGQRHLNKGPLLKQKKREEKKNYIKYHKYLGRVI